MIRQLVGDCRVRLAELPAESVHCVPTSPPYFSLRDYGTPPLVWGGDANHVHDWLEVVKPAANGIVASAMQGETMNGTSGTRRPSTSGLCACGAWCGSLGLEPTPELYIDHLSEVFRAVWRVLRKDGTVWLNIGDSYAGSGKGPSNSLQPDASQLNKRKRNASQFANGQAPTVWTSTPQGLKPKNLLMIPARVALRLQADGWYVRSDIAWCKRSHMPESVEDRPTNAWEHIFLLTKDRHYFYDAEAVREEGDWDGRSGHRAGPRVVPTREGPPDMGLAAIKAGSRNMRNWWLLGPEPFSEAHFATFVTEVPRRAILAGTSEKGCCSTCGAPWKRIIERSYGKSPVHGKDSHMRNGHETTDVNGWAGMPRVARHAATVGWRPTCAHAEAPVVPCTVLDPFSGAGTTLMVADRYGRDAIGCELSPTYAPMAINRIRKDAPMFAEVAAD